ncbi:MAG: hypothetical protein B7Z63_01720, partial [Ignavibacteriae bacterium 37-53-5]
EYARFKEASRSFDHLQEEGSRFFYRTYFKNDDRQFVSPEDDELKDVTLIDLITAFKRAMDKLETTPYHNIQRLNVTIEEKIDFLVAAVEDKPTLHFLEIAVGIHERIRLVVTFIALLELIKRNILRVQTRGGFNDFIITRYDALPEEPAAEEDNARAAS